MEILLSEEFNESITLLINVITVYLAFKFRKPFKERYSGAGRFYDTLLLSTIVWFIAECFYAPAYFSGYFDEKFIEKSGWIADNLWIAFQLLFLYAFVSLFGALIRKYRVEIIKEHPLESTAGVSLQPGAYIIPPEREKETFLSILQKYPGLIISRNPPEIIKNEFKLEKTPVLWLTKVECENCIWPTNLEYLGHLIINFLKKDNVPKVVLLENLEYLVLENGFDRVFKFLSSLRDYAILTGSILLITAMPDAWNKKEWTLLTKEFPIVNIKKQEKHSQAKKTTTQKSAPYL